MRDFLTGYRVAKAEFNDDQSTVAKWNLHNGEGAEPESVLVRLQQNRQAVEEQEKNREKKHDRKDREAR